MIRNLTLVNIKPGTTEQQIRAVEDALRSLKLSGLMAMTMGRDLGLREGNMDFGLVIDFEDEDAYHAFDGDAEHNRIRRELIAPIADRVERCQFRVEASGADPAATQRREPAQPISES